MLAERARLAHEVAARLETELHAQQEEYRVLPLLAERVELLRAERQRLEDRTSRGEESLEDARLRARARGRLHGARRCAAEGVRRRASTTSTRRRWTSGAR